MPRYDEGWGPRGPLRPGGEYGDDFRPHTGFGGGGHEADYGRGAPYPDERDGFALYGPARYGLGPYHQRLRQRRRPDDELKQEVEEVLFFDTWVDAEAIRVEVSDGVVTLRGELPDYQEVRYATDDAWDVDGVRGVHSELTVNGLRRARPDGVEDPR